VLNSALLTQYGRQVFQLLPFTQSSSQDIFQRAMSEMFEGIQGVEVVVDNLFVWGEQHDCKLMKEKTSKLQT